MISIAINRTRRAITATSALTAAIPTVVFGAVLGLMSSASAQVEVSSETSELLQLGAGNLPYIGDYAAPIVGLIFTPPDEMDLLRQEMREYVDLAVLRQAHGLIYQEIGEWRNNLADADRNRREGLFNEAAGSLKYLDDEIVGAMATFTGHMDAAADDAYLAVYGSLAVFHLNVLNARAEMLYLDEWPKNGCNERIGVGSTQWIDAWGPSEACAYFARMGRVYDTYASAIYDEIARSVDRRGAAVGEVEFDLYEGPQLESGGVAAGQELTVDYTHPYFVDDRLGSEFPAGIRRVGAIGNAYYLDRMRYVSRVQDELRAYWETNLIQALDDAVPCCPPDQI